jgi:hypothetical protein
MGNLQHLKSRYGEGYTLLVKLALSDIKSSSTNNNNNDDALLNPKTKKINDFIHFILSKFSNAIVKENRDGFLNLHINDNSTQILSSIFSLIEHKKEEFSIEYYVVTQTNLEQIFLNFASKQIDPESRFMKKSLFKCC